MTIPRVAEDLTPEWLSEVLGRSIAGVAIEPIGVGVGLVGSLFRLRLDGEPWNHKRVLRVYREMRLNLPRRTRRRDHGEALPNRRHHP